MRRFLLFVRVGLGAWFTVLLVASCSGDSTASDDADSPFLGSVLSDGELISSVRPGAGVPSSLWATQLTGTEAATQYHDVASQSGLELVRVRCGGDQFSLSTTYRDPGRDGSAWIQVWPVFDDAGEFSTMHVRASLGYGRQGGEPMALEGDTSCLERHLERLSISGTIPQLLGRDLEDLVPELFLSDETSLRPQSAGLGARSLKFVSDGHSFEIRSAESHQTHEWFGIAADSIHRINMYSDDWWVGYDGGALVVDAGRSGKGREYAQALSERLNG